MPRPARSLPRQSAPHPAQLELVTDPPSLAPREPEQLPLLRMLEVVRDRVDAIHASQHTLHAQLQDIRTSLPMQRRPLSRRTRALHLYAVLTRRNGRCPCCQDAEVCNADGRLPGAEFDHFFARDKNRPNSTWLLCADCHRRMSSVEGRAAARSAFEAYQQALRPLLSRQATLELEAKGE